LSYKLLKRKQEMQIMRIIATLLICSLFIESIESRPSFAVKRLKGVVDLDNKHDIKNLIGVLKNYLHNKNTDESTEESENGEVIAEEERSEIGGNSEETGGETKQMPGGSDVQEAHAGTTRGNVRVYKYKVDFYTMDHPLSEVKKWMKKGFNAWSNPRIDAYLRKHNCPTLKFEETTNNDFDFAINFDYEFFDRYDPNRLLSWFWEADKTIYINDHHDLRRDWIAHAVAYDTCDMLGCKCTKHAGQNEIMACGPVSDWDIFEPTRHDFRTMAAALGCQTPNLY